MLTFHGLTMDIEKEAWSNADHRTILIREITAMVQMFRGEEVRVTVEPIRRCRCCREEITQEDGADAIRRGCCEDCFTHCNPETGVDPHLASILAGMGIPVPTRRKPVLPEEYMNPLVECSEKMHRMVVEKAGRSGIPPKGSAPVQRSAVSKEHIEDLLKLLPEIPDVVVQPIVPVTAANIAKIRAALLEMKKTIPGVQQPARQDIPSDSQGGPGENARSGQQETEMQNGFLKTFVRKK